MMKYQHGKTQVHGKEMNVTFCPNSVKKKKGCWVIATQTQLRYWKCLAPQDNKQGSKWVG